MVKSGGITEDLIRIRLFFISYVPLWVMLAFRAVPPGKWHWDPPGRWHCDTRAGLVVLFVFLAVWGFVDAIRLIRGSNRICSRTLVFGEVADQGGNAAGYLATYLLPFIGLIPTDWGDWAAYGIYFVVAGVVFIRTDLTFVNPTLYVLRYRVVSGNAYVPESRSLVPGSPFVIICRDPGALISAVDVTSIGGGYVVKRMPEADRGNRRTEALPGSRGDLSEAGRERGMEGN
jgi:hypothetical protein